MTRRVSYIIWLFLSVSVALSDPIEEDAQLNTFELIQKYGYPAEYYTVQTDDGYILTMQRIARPTATPVLLIHGLLDSSASWVMMGPNKGLAYLLYEQGYDVWLGNTRGNTYAKKHVKYSTDQKEFWDFSFHELGIFDLPNTIDYVLNNTGFSQLHYVGHSQGTTAFWVMGSERPAYMEKIILMQALAPVAYWKYTKSPVGIYLGASNIRETALIRIFGANEFLPSTEFSDLFADRVCGKSGLGADICSNALFAVAGYSNSQMNETMLPVIFAHSPAGASTKQLVHVGQIRASDKFRQFDYGAFENLQRYKSLSPPNYKLNNVMAKVALYYGQNDWVAQPRDVSKLYFELPNVVLKYLVKYPAFNHMDFIWAIDARELLYDHMLENMRSVQSK